MPASSQVLIANPGISIPKRKLQTPCDGVREQLGGCLRDSQGQATPAPQRYQKSMQPTAETFPVSRNFKVTSC